MFNPERPKTDFDPLKEFNRDIIVFCPEAWRAPLENVCRLSEKGQVLIEESVVECFGDLSGLVELKKSLSVLRDNYNIEANIIPLSPVEGIEALLGVRAILIKHASDKPPEYAGYVSLLFGYEKQQPLMYVSIYEVKEQGKGIGLDSECQLEDFCRRHNIWTIENNSTSDKERGDVGGYVWALYGYEFGNESDIGHIIKNIIDFAAKNEIIIDEEALRACQRPIDFARFKGKNKNRDEVPVGKLSLLEYSEWNGRRDLDFNSQGTKDFVAYLKQRGRDDLIEKYYPMFLEKNSKMV